MFILTSRKTEIAEDVLAESYLVQKSMVIWLQLITKFSAKVVNLETIIDMQSWCKTWLPNGSSRVRAKQNFSGNKICSKKFLEPNWKPKVIYTDNSLEFGKACEDLPCSHCTSTPHRSETNGIAERAVRRVKEGTSAVLLQSGLNESWWADSMECYTYLRNVTDLLSDGKTPYERRFGQPFKGPIIPFGSLVQDHPITAKDQSRIHQFGRKILPGLFHRYALSAGWIWKGDVLVADLEELERMDASEIYSKKDSMRKRWHFPNKDILFFSNRKMDE